MEEKHEDELVAKRIGDAWNLSESYSKE